MDLTKKILGDFKLNYDVVDDLKKIKVNIPLFELHEITTLREQLHEVLQHIQGPQDVEIGNSNVTLKGKNTKATKSTKTSSVASTSCVKIKENTTIDKEKPDPKVDATLIGRKSRSNTLPFLLIFKISIKMYKITLLIMGIHQI